MSTLFFTKSTYLDLVKIDTRPYRRETNFNLNSSKQDIEA